MVIVALCLTFFLTVTLSMVLTKPIQELTEVTTKMVRGDLSQRVKVHGADEIGLLGTSFNRMIGQIENYTSNLQKWWKREPRSSRSRREKYRDLSRFLNSILDSATEYAIVALDFLRKDHGVQQGGEKLFGWKKG
jgi:nitrogen fixation/metabolism regulation signal transduction histidine kinase